MGNLLHMPSSIDAAFSDPESPFNQPEPETLDVGEIQDAMCDCGHVFYLATLPEGIMASEYWADWSEPWTPFYDASGLVYCSKECREDAQDGLNLARGIVSALIICSPFWVGIGLLLSGVRL